MGVVGIARVLRSVDLYVHMILYEIQHKRYYPAACGFGVIFDTDYYRSLAVFQLLLFERTWSNITMSAKP